MTGHMLGELARDFRAAFRSMTQYPAACLVAVISLAGGIGCATATLTIRDAVFYNPPPLIENPEELSVAGIST